MAELAACILAVACARIVPKLLVGIDGSGWEDLSKFLASLPETSGGNLSGIIPQDVHHQQANAPWPSDFIEWRA